jgi:SlyX protein
MQDRVTEIEIKIAHMEQSLGELSDVLYQQQSLLDRFERRFDELRQGMEAAADDRGDNNPADEKPPHY